ncbi:hypothetical protein Tco_1003547 [Tanacetum coccineum]|uniref:Zinc finger, CCHC-type, retrotransposon Gag domain protein n=1 Tax=Tanacetum coccineum TaxID=301880 RepID=A0ABQ5FA04_9ASTR
MVTTRRNSDDDVPNFEAMITAAVANALPNLTAALRTQITNDIRNGAGPSGGGGGDAIPQGIHVWIERFTKLKPLAFRSAATPAEAEDWITHMEKLFQVLGCPDNFKTRLAAFKLEGDALSYDDPLSVSIRLCLSMVSEMKSALGFDGAVVIALTTSSIELEVFRAGCFLVWVGYHLEFPKFPYFVSKYAEGPCVTMPMSKCLKRRTHNKGVVDSRSKIVATRIRKANAAAKRKAEKNREIEGAGGSEGSSKRRKEKSSDHIPCPTPLRTIEAVTSDVSRGDNVISPTQTQGDNLLEIPAHDSANTTTRLYEEHHDEHSGVLGNRDGNFDDDVDEEIDLEGPDRHVSDTTERVVIETESIPTAATRPDNGKSIAQEETPMPDPPPQGVGADGAGSSLPPSLFVPSWGIHQRRKPVLLGRGAMAQALHLCQFESLYDTHHALQESLETTRGQLVRTREDFNVVQNFYNTLSGKHRQLREEHAQCSEGLAVVQAEKDSLMATNAEQAWIQRNDSDLVYAEWIFLVIDSRNEGLRAKPGLCPKEMTNSFRKLLPLWWRSPTGHVYKQSRSVDFNYALQNGMGARLFSRLIRMWIDLTSLRCSARSLKLHPSTPIGLSQGGFRVSYCLAPKLVKAAEVARSKDTTSREFSRSKTGPSLQDPASKHASGGSQAPPSKKT